MQSTDILPPILPQTTEGKSPIPGTSLMLLGGVGSGKTSTCRSWIESGVQVCGIFTEPSWEVIADIPCPNLHFIYLQPITIGWASMIDSAQKINTLSFESLSKLPDINKSKFKDFISLLTVLSSYKCERCGVLLGPVDEWSTGRVLVVDSLSGLNIMAMNLVVGSKPVKSIADWGVAMDNEERLIQKLCIDRRCHFMLTAHIEREMDEITGISTAMPSALGRKLAPRLPRFFSDVVLTRRQGDKFEWSTTASGFDLKARNLPFSDHLPASIGPILDSWKKRGGVMEPVEGLQK